MAANIELAITERHIGAEVTMVALATSDCRVYRQGR